LIPGSVLTQSITPVIGSMQFSILYNDTSKNSFVSEYAVGANVVENLTTPNNVNYTVVNLSTPIVTILTSSNPKVLNTVNL
jgi:thiamine pyrophosphokinase